jgi:hypothetical protein
VPGIDQGAMEVAAAPKGGTPPSVAASSCISAEMRAENHGTRVLSFRVQRIDTTESTSYLGAPVPWCNRFATVLML